MLCDNLSVRRCSKCLKDLATWLLSHLIFLTYLIISELTFATMKISLASASFLLTALTTAVLGQDNNDPADALVRMPLAPGNRWRI